MTNNRQMPAQGAGLRERKRRETLKRITDTGMRLFIENGYEATTLDDIAAAAGISRRTFFYYFRSKDEILLSLQSGMGEMIVTALREEDHDKRPIDAIRDAILKVCAPFPVDDVIVIDHLMRSIETVQARKQATYVEHERALFAALREKWPAPERETGLRLVAMLAIGTMRLSFDRFGLEAEKRPLTDLLNESFNALQSEV